MRIERFLTSQKLLKFRPITRKIAIYSLTVVSFATPYLASHCKAHQLFTNKGASKYSLGPSSKKSFVAEAVSRSAEAIVTIDTERKVFTNYRNFSLPPNLLIDPYFQRLFGLPNLQSTESRIERGQGSGIIFSSEGLVLTNAHVVEKTDYLTVGISDGRRVTGRVVGQDSITDLAVIRLDGEGTWPQAIIGNSDKINVGDWAIAVGNPYGLEKTVTLGIISNLNRNVSQLGISDKRLNLIQTDAAINPGNSGGPLLNSEGEVIGINTLVRSGPGAGLGFAIPINKAIEIANQLVIKGKAIHPMIGVNLSRLEVSRNQVFNNNSKGVIVVYVLPGGPAEKGGIKVNDIILSINRKDMKKPQDIVDLVNSNGIQNEMEFRLLRNRREFSIKIKPVDISNFRIQ